MPDADIDATDAWDITTECVTALGDTIVVAIIDGGVYINHEDLDCWKNYNEIPNNGIDDDENGYEQGAFVVATNASFGVDLGQPEDYPLWGAIYDSLGIQGVLSTGATVNHNWNIDEVGDVPTAFESGIYFYQLKSDKNVLRKKMVLVK